MKSPGELPESLAPMLARLEKKPFDSEEHFFEIKWDGYRALAFVESGAYRLRSRNGHDFSARFPELAFLSGLEPGCVLDGELVVLGPEGRPDFGAMQQRGQARGGHRASALAAELPVSFVVFDLPYRNFESQCERPFTERRAALEEVVGARAEHALVLSDGVLEHGVSLFEEVRKQGMEGIVAKRLTSHYVPGERTDDWLKVKARTSIPCIVLGYVPEAERELKSLIVGADFGAGLQCVGKVGSGLGEKTRRELLDWLRAHPADKPLVECPFEGRWVKPGLYCRVSYVERTRAGQLRAPVFEGLLNDGLLNEGPLNQGL